MQQPEVEMYTTGQGCSAFDWSVVMQWPFALCGCYGNGTLPTQCWAHYANN